MELNSQQPAAAPAPDQSEVNAVIQHKSPKRWLRYGIIAFITLIIIFLAGSATAEFGLVNTGFDRLYGRTKLAGLWGSMPANPVVAVSALLENPELITIPENASTDFDYTLAGNFTSVFSAPQSSQTTAAPADQVGSADQSIKSPALSGALDNAISVKPVAPTTTTNQFEASLKGTGLTLNSGEQAETSFTLRLDSDIEGFENLALQTRVIVDEQDVYYQIPSSLNLLRDSALWLSTLPKDAGGKFVKTNLYLPSAQVPQRDALKVLDGDTIMELLGIDEDEFKEIVKLLAQITRRVGIERINGDIASHWQIKANTDDIIPLLDPNITEGDYQEIIEAFSLDLTVDFWVRHGDYVILKTTNEIKASIDSGQNFFSGDFTLTGKQTINPNIEPTSITLPPKDQTIDAEDLLNPSPAAPDDASQDDTVISAPTSPTTAGSERERDNERTSELLKIAVELDKTYRATGKLPVAGSVIKVQDMPQINLADSAKRDPLEPYYYGYLSLDGKSYTLTTIIEDESYTECEVMGSLCVYKINSNFLTP